MVNSKTVLVIIKIIIITTIIIILIIIIIIKTRSYNNFRLSKYSSHCVL